MKADRLPLIIVIAFFMVSSAGAQDRWGEDHLVGHFPMGLTQVGPGYSHFDCFSGTNNDVFVAFIEDSTTSSGDLLRIRKSFDGGLTWTHQKTVAGSTNKLYSPNVVQIPGTSLILASIITVWPNGLTFLDTYTYQYGNLAYIDYSTADFSYPGAGTPVSCILVPNGSSGEVWLFALDDNGWLFLTRTSDGQTWTPSAPVAANVKRPHAAVSSDGHVAVVWLDSSGGGIKCAVADSNADFQPAVTVSAAASGNASPIASWEHLGAENLGVVWHSGGGDSFLGISSDGGATWWSPQLLGEGVYPFIDIYPGTRRAVACYTTEEGAVEVGAALTLAGIPAADFAVRSGHEAYTEGPSRVVFGETSDKQVLFFISPATDYMWLNSSLIAGIEEGEGTGTPVVIATPNPSGGGIFTVIPTGFTGAVEYTVYSLDGREVLRETSDSEGITVDSSDLPAGVYTIMVEDGSSRATCRLVRFQP